MSAHPPEKPAAPAAPAPADAASKAYQPSAIEPVITKKWAESGAFHPDPQRVLRGEAKPYSIVIPPPNVTGALHLGHALNNTLQDILTRAHRMMGFETLWMPGTDHAGIATQAVVEKRLLKEEGKRRKDFTREQFVARVQEWKDEYEARITTQLRAMGCSCDFERQRFTMDDICARAVREAFFVLFRDGLIYRGKRLVNWDPVLQTAVADDECYDEEVDSNFWYMRYPLETPVKLPSGETIDHVTVATTRPETYLGDSGVAMNPSDPRAAALNGQHVILPLVGRRIPIVLDDYVVLPAAMAKTEEARSDPKAAFATGFLKVTPAHDKNDEQIGLRHKLAAINMMSPDGRVSDKHGWNDVGQAGEFVGKTMAEARKAVAAKFKELGLLEEVRPYRQTISHSDRSKAVIEPYLSDQWYVRVTDDRLSGAANRALVAEQRSEQSLSRQREVDAVGVWAVTPRATFGASHPDEGDPAYEDFGSAVATACAELCGVDRRSVFTKWDAIKQTTRVCTLDAAAEKTMAVFAAWLASGAAESSLDKAIPGAAARKLASIVSAWAAGGADASPESALAYARGSEGTGDGAMTFHPSRYAKTYEQWHDNIRDWCISRQLWWGHRIPVWGHPRLDATAFAGVVEFCDDPDLAGFDKYSDWNVQRCFNESDSEVLKGHIPTEPFFVSVRPGRADLEKRLEAAGFTQDPDVLDTWFSSALWPLSTMGWPGSSEYRIHLLDPADDAGPDGIAPRERAIAAIRSYLQSQGVHEDVSIEVESGADLDFVWLKVLARSDRAMQVVKKMAPVRYTKEESEARYRQHSDGVPAGDKLAAARYWIDGGQEGTDLLRAFNPTSVLSTAREIITLWVSRMVMMNRYLLGTPTLRVGSDGHGPHAERGGTQSTHGQGHGPVPFRDVFIHAVVQDGEGRKMSKSLGNGVDPLDIIESHGADAMRFTLCQMTTQTQDVRMPVVKDSRTGKNTSPKFDLGRNFCNKLWNASRFAIGMLPKAGQTPGSESRGTQSPIDAASLSLVDRWMLSRLASTTRQIDGLLKNYEFSDYAEAVYRLLWWDVCDWYLEAIKPTIASSPAQQAVLAHALEVVVRLLHPITPFVTEAVWEQLRSVQTAPIAGIELGGSRTGLLCTAGWPRLSERLIDAEAEKTFESLRELVSAIRNARSEHQVPPRRKITLHASSAALKLMALSPGLVETLAGVEKVEAAAPGTGVAAVVVRAMGEEMRLSNLADAIDAGAEKERLAKQLEQLVKSEAALAGRLNNPGYVERAPAKLVEESKAQLAKIQGEIAGIKERLAAL